MKSLTVKTKEFLKKLPSSPGVYLFKDKKGGIIYVGRAASLRSRVSSYFSSKVSEAARRPAEQFAGEAEKIFYEKTSNLLEAAILENNLIKKHAPKYNIKDKDNRSFVYLFFDMKKDFPRPVIVRGRELGKYSPRGEIVGPYASFRFLKNILSVARQIFPYSTCLPADKPCFHRQIGLCPGVCTGEISSEDYKRNIKKLIRLLKSGKADGRRLNDIVLIPEEFVFAGGSGLDRVEAYDISHLQGRGVYGAMSVLEEGIPSPGEYRLFKIKKAKPGDDAAAFEEMLARRLARKEWVYPDIIIVDGGRQQVNAAAAVLRKLSLQIPIVGINKAGRHAQSSAAGEVMVFSSGMKKTLRELFSSKKIIFQRARNEAHRFCLKAMRRSQSYKKRHEKRK